MKIFNSENIIIKFNSSNIEPHVYWFRKIYNDTMYDEGWNIVLSFVDGDNLQYIITKLNRIRKKEISKKQAYKVAKEYGWVLDKKGVILEYDETKHIRNKHLATANDLNLL